MVGNFPIPWSEWNGKYRDCIRRYWKGDEDTMAEFAYRLTGSPDLYEHQGKRPYASINFITAHDGFTLNDLVSYNDKHNEANGEDNRDGDNNNNSWNCGAEGPTDDAAGESRSADGNVEISWRPSCSLKACRCSTRETNSPGLSKETTTPIVRTTAQLVQLELG